MNNLVKRSITGIVFVALIVASLLISRGTWGVLTLFLSFLGSYELALLLKKAGITESQPSVSGFSSIMFFSAAFILFIQSEFTIISLLSAISGLALLLIFSFFTSNYFRSLLINFTSSAFISLPFALSGLLIILSPEGNIINQDIIFNFPSYNPYLIISIFILIWVFDSFAYITGSIAGKHKILPNISPAKSWEGFIGGFVFMIPVLWILKSYLGLFTLTQWIGLALIVAIIGSIGDFFFSAIKRKAGVKDSGKILPGHGGILDRFDSFIFVIPFAAFYLVIISLIN